MSKNVDRQEENGREAAEAYEAEREKSTYLSRQKTRRYRATSAAVVILRRQRLFDIPRPSLTLLRGRSMIPANLWPFL